MDRRTIVTIASLLLVPCVPLAAAVRSVKVVYDHQANRLTCGPTGVTDDVCVVSVRPGDIVSVQVVNSVPGLLEVDMVKTDRPRPAATESISAIELPPVIGSAFPGLIAKGDEEGAPREPQQIYADINAQIRLVQHALHHDLAGYEGARRTLGELRNELLIRLEVPDDGDAVTEALFEAGGVRATEEQIVEWWENLTHLLSVAPESLQSFRPVHYTYDDDFDIQIGFASNSELVTAPSHFPMIAVREQGGWRVSTSTGIAFSRLKDDEYTVQEIMEPDDEGDVRMRRVAVEEEGDVINPEPALFIHLTPGWEGFFDRFQLTFGVGVDADSGGRTYAGLSYRFGSAGSILIGAAGGQVKRLSASVDPNDLGDIDPNDVRKDVFDVDAMFALSWRFGRE
jgi:hypothetical protein